ncbi:MAG: discoidin domain-containing protein, partial [Bacteroidota bacterium]
IMKKNLLFLFVLLIGGWNAKAQEPIPKDGWSVSEVSSFLSHKPAGNAIDDDPGTFWSNDWNAGAATDDYPIHITVDFGAEYELCNFTYTHRNNTYEQIPKDWAVWVSTDGVTYDSITGGNWENTLPWTDMKRTEYFSAPVAARYLKIEGKNGPASSDEAQTQMCIAELDVAVAGGSANYEADQTTINRYESVSFTDKSSNSPVAWAWTFEGGTPASSTDPNPVVSYNNTGSFDVQLVSIPDAGDPTQNDTLLTEEYITVSKATDFSADLTTVGRGGTVQFTDASAGTPIGWEWSFTGGTPETSTDQNPSVVYDVAGTYDVELITIYEAGDPGKRDTLARTGYITVTVLADFEADQVNIAIGNQVTFTDLSQNQADGWAWTFEGGDPATSDQQNPVVTYYTRGTYDVQLIATNSADPTKDDTRLIEDYITVSEPRISQADWNLIYYDSKHDPKPPEAAFDGDETTWWHTKWTDPPDPMPHTLIIDLGAKYELKGFSYLAREAQNNGFITEYEFYVTTDLPAAQNTPDGTWGSPASTGTWDAPWDAPKDEYFASSQIGRYIIFHVLASDDPLGNFCHVLELYAMGEKYGADFSVDKTEAYETQAVAFTDMSAGTPVAWQWFVDFTEGETNTPVSTEQNPTVKLEPGIHDITLVMTPLSGAAQNDTLTKPGYIIVTAKPAGVLMPKEGWSLILDPPDADPGSMENIFDDDKYSLWNTGSTLFPQEIIINLGELANIVGFEYIPRDDASTTGIVEGYKLYSTLDLEFYDLLSEGAWENVSNDKRTVYFDSPIDARAVRFVIDSTFDNEAATTAEINVLISFTGPEFGASKTAIAKGESIDFYDFSSDEPTGWQWTFEGGTPSNSTDQCPEGITYDLFGTYSVTLTTTGGGDAGTVTKTAYVTVDYMLPEIFRRGGDQNTYIDTIQIGDVFQNVSAIEGGYVDNTDMDIPLYRGETYSILLNTVCKEDWYKHAQAIWIDLDADGYFDNETEKILDHPFIPNNSNQTTVVDLTIPVDAPLGETRMRVMGRFFGQECFPYDPFQNGAELAYGEVEDYTLTIADLSAEVPVADFSSDITAVCAGGTVQYADLSTNTPTEWSWTFEGGTPATSNLRSPVVTYETAGTYDVSLTAGQVSGSDDESKTDYLTANALPVNVSAGSDQEVCMGAEVTLTGSGDTGLTFTWDNSVVDGVPFVPAIASDYILTGTDAIGCSLADTVSISLYPQVDTSITVTETTLTSNNAFASSWQWINCSDNSEISGATAVSYTPTETGDYAVVVNDGTCSDISGCHHVVIVGVSNNNLINSTLIYPNPSNGKVNIAVDRDKATIKVYNSLGSLVLIREKTSTIETMEFTTKGLYFIEIESEGELHKSKVIIN